MATRYFSLDAACALIPHIRSQLGIALQLHARLRGVVEQINDAGYDVDWATLHGEVDLDDEARPTDLRNLEKARGIYALLQSVVEGIEDEGVLVKGVVDGLVDFHSWRDGQHEVLLCWKLGESTIEHYHGVREGFAGRRPVTGHRFLGVRDARASEEASAKSATENLDPTKDVPPAELRGELLSADGPSRGTRDLAK